VDRTKNLKDKLAKKIKSDTEDSKIQIKKPNLWDKIKNKSKTLPQFPSKSQVFSELKNQNLNNENEIEKNQDNQQENINNENLEEKTTKRDKEKDKKKMLTHKQILENMQKRDEERKAKAEMKKKIQEKLEKDSNIKPKPKKLLKPQSKRKKNQSARIAEESVDNDEF